VELQRAEPGSIARRLALIVAAVTVLVTVLSLSTLLAWSQRRYDESLHRRAQALLRYLEGSLSLPLWSLDAETAATIGAAVAHDEVVSALEIVDHRGGVYFRQDKGERVAFDETGKLFYENQPIGEVRLRISARPGQRFLGRVAAVAGISGVLVIALQLLLIGPLLRRQLRAPFSTLNATIQSYQAGRYDVPRPAIPFSEFDPITDVLARMGRTLEQQIGDLRAAEAKYRRIFETARVGIFRTTPAGAWVDVNPAWLEFMGFESLEDLQTHVKNVRQLYADPADRDALLAQLGRAGHVSRLEVRLRRKQGDLVWGSITADAVLDPQGRVSLIEGIVDDVTEAKRIQELLIQTEKMTSVGGLAAGMAHELNNPLGIVLQSLENLERRLSPGLAANEPAAREAGVDLNAVGQYMDRRGIPEYLAATRQAAERAATIIRTMLDFSRTAGAAPGPCELRDIVDTALELAAKDYDLRRKFDFRTVRIVRELDPQTPPVACTAREMVQVVLNVVKNAAEALAEAGAGEPTIHVRTRSDGSFARLEIEDNGPGMDEPTRRRVFEPYFSTKAPGEGTGLGLSVAYFIVTQRNGGTITVASTPGQGSEFVIRLPVAAAHSPAATTDSAARTDSAERSRS
jgi:PAS domain S-box-containing protein